MISIHALREEGDPAFPSQPSAAGYFYPRPPRGGRPHVSFPCFHARLFLSTPSARRATPSPSIARMAPLFLSTPSARRATECFKRRIKPNVFLSTPSARRATPPRRTVPPFCMISIHALREEGDGGVLGKGHGQKNFYPRPPRGGRQIVKAKMTLTMEISIHALREEGDEPFIVQITASSLFLSTPSARRATNGHGRRPSAFADFYPRPPRGGRLRTGTQSIKP